MKSGEFPELQSNISRDYASENYSIDGYRGGGGGDRGEKNVSKSKTPRERDMMQGNRIRDLEGEIEILRENDRGLRDEIGKLKEDARVLRVEKAQVESEKNNIEERNLMKNGYIERLEVDLKTMRGDYSRLSKEYRQIMDLVRQSQFPAPSPTNPDGQQPSDVACSFEFQTGTDPARKNSAETESSQNTSYNSLRGSGHGGGFNWSFGSPSTNHGTDPVSKSIHVMENVGVPEVVEVGSELEESGPEYSENFKEGPLKSNLSPMKRNFDRPDKPKLSESLNESDPDGTRFMKKESDLGEAKREQVGGTVGGRKFEGRKGSGTKEVSVGGDKGRSKSSNVLAGSGNRSEKKLLERAKVDIEKLEKRSEGKKAGSPKGPKKLGIYERAKEKAEKRKTEDQNRRDL